ncbi:MAG: hypothetical protein CMH76_12410 [Nitrospinae bacterium]|nr:hypothetical protein [Nitrospinota bacterium]
MTFPRCGDELIMRNANFRNRPIVGDSGGFLKSPGGCEAPLQEKKTLRRRGRKISGAQRPAYLLGRPGRVRRTEDSTDDGHPVRPGLDAGGGVLGPHPRTNK